MSLDNIFPNLDNLIRVPEDVAQVNAAILDLAVKGMLVPQADSDEPANTLLNSIRQGKLGIEDGEGLSKRSKNRSSQRDSSQLSAPRGWQLVRLGEVVELRNGRAYKQTELLDRGTPVIRIQNLNGGDKWYYSDLELADEKYCSEGDLLYAWSGTFGPYIWHGPRSIYHYHIWRVDLFPDVDKKYMYYLLKSISASVRGDSHGVMLLHMTKAGMEDIQIPLPPLAEQHRIVAKVDELLAQTSALEANLRRAQEEIVVVNQAALHRLETAEDPRSLHAAWHTISGAFDLLYDDPRPLAALRRTILQLAVSGKLVRQNESDEPGGELLRRIHDERTEQIGADDLEPNAGAPVTEFPYDIPNSWALTRLARLADILGGVTKGRNLSPFATVILPYLRVANVQRGYLDLYDVKDIEVRAEEQAKYALQVGDLLLTEGGDADKLGRTAIWRGQIPDCIHQNHIFRARLRSAELLPEWFMLYLNSGYGQSYFLGSAKQTTNLATINMRQLRRCPIPVPPAAEQRRIVAKVDELLGTCDVLERELDRSVAAQKAAVASVLAHISEAPDTAR